MLLRRAAGAGGALRTTRSLCAAASSSGASPLSRWGSFGSTEEQIEEMVERVKQDGAQHARIMAQLAEIGFKMHASLTRPQQWFGDPEWRKSWIDQMSEPIEHYSRINDRLMDGCEHAYQAVADEFCAADDKR